MSREYRICKRCIMDTSDSTIQFDEEGLCNHCRAYKLRAARELDDKETAKAKLDQLVARIKQDGKGRPYDCIIGVSGGVDSTMVAYLVKKLGLRPLAVHLDNGWNAELAVHNIEKTLKKLDIDLYTYVIDWDEFRDLQMAFFKASVANIEVLTDHAIDSVLFKTAAKNKIRYVISGGNIATEAIMPQSWMYDARDLRHIVSIHKKFGTRPIKTFPTNSLFTYFSYVFVNRIKYVSLLNYTNYVKSEAKETIQNELGWKDYGYKHYESIFTRFFQAYILPEKFKIDKRRAHLSTLICANQVSREQALMEVEKPPYPVELFKDDYNFFLKKMQLTEEEFQKIMKLPIKTHEDYPSNSYVFRNNPWLIQLVKKIVKPSELKSAQGKSASNCPHNCKA